MTMNTVKTTSGDLPRLHATGSIDNPTHSATRVSARELVNLLRCECEIDPALDAKAFTTRRVRMGEVLYRAGDACQSFFVVRSGVLKTVVMSEEGIEQVLSFRIKGDPVGMDGVGSGRHASEAIALENAEVIIVPVTVLSRFARTSPALEGLAYRTLSRELVREQSLIYVIGSLRAEARVAAFLVNLSDRFGALGYARTSLVLRMTRQEIGSYLGLQLETVSRTFSAFAAAGFIEVNLKNIEILNMAALRRVLSEPVSARAMDSHARPQTPSTRSRTNRVLVRDFALAA